VLFLARKNRSKRNRVPLYFDYRVNY